MAAPISEARRCIDTSWRLVPIFSLSYASLMQSRLVSLIVVALVTTAFAASSSAQPRPLRLGSDVWPPFTGDEGEPRVAIELVTEALKRAGIKSGVRMVRIGQLTPGLENGRFDGTPAIWRSREREKRLLYSKPYLENRLVLVGRKSADVSAKRLAVLSGKRVAIVKAFAYGREVSNAKGVTFVRGDSDQGNLRRLLAGEVDYMLVDDLLAHRLVTAYQAQTKRLLKVGRHSLITRTLHFAVRRDLEGAARIVDAFNAQIGKMMADGSIHKILEVDWIRTDMDGDGNAELVLGGKRAGAKPPIASYEWLTLQKRPKGKRSRIWIEGITYENWEQVPRRYKVEPEPLVPQRKGGIRFRFDLGL